MKCNHFWLELRIQSLNKNEKIISQINMCVFIVSLVRNGSPSAVTIDCSGFHL